MSSRLPSKEQALQILHKTHTPPDVILHCKSVAKIAEETAKACRKKGLDVDLSLVEIGALLHDIGRSKTHSVSHAVVGAEIAKKNGLPEPVIAIIERHVGGGITEQEAFALGWPAGKYLPDTIEQKIVSYADKLVETSKRVPVEETIKKLQLKNLNEAAERVRKIHDEISHLVEDP